MGKIIKHGFSTSLLALLFILSTISSAWGEVQVHSGKFLRLSHNSNNVPTSLDTSIVTYSNDTVQVDLISALHIAESSYYETLNKEFEKYDALLFELVAPEDVDLKLKRKEGSSNLLTMVQNALKDALGLEFQLEKINYTKPNFVHADMTPEDFSKSMKARGESIFSIFLKILLRSQEFMKDNPQKSSEMLLLEMIFDPQRTISLRGLLAQQFEDVEALTEVIDGPEGSTLISERNKKALSVLKAQIAGGKKHLGIFYGAGHMPSMEKTLLSDFGLKQTNQRWIVAWKL